MKIYITMQGDPSVGIWPATAEVEIPFKNAEDCMQWRDGDRNTLRKEFKDFYENNIFGDKCNVIFDDECPDCGFETSQNSCYNPNCISNEPDENPNNGNYP